MGRVERREWKVESSVMSTIADMLRLSRDNIQIERVFGDWERRGSDVV